MSNMKWSHADVAREQLRVVMLETPLDNRSWRGLRTVGPQDSVNKMVVTQAQVKRYRCDDRAGLVGEDYIN